jgi:DNA-directed RNA polymerase subunit alpha
MPVEQLNLSVRTMNCLRRGGIDIVGQLIGKEERELLALRNFGQKSMRELEERLKEIGLSFKALAGEPVPATEEEEEEAEHEA